MSIIWSTAIFKENSRFNIINNEPKNLSKIFGRPKIRTSKSHIHTIADPFLVRRQQILYLFAEVQMINRPGFINCWSTDDGLSWTDHGVTLRKSSHLSFPFIFQEKDDFFMIPEQIESGKTEIYRFNDFPNQLSWFSTICDEPIEDPILIKSNSVFYLLGTFRDRLRLLFTNNLDGGPWSIHPMDNQIKSKKIRNAGNPIEIDGTHYRFTQDCSGTYGKEIMLKKIINLDKYNFQEKVIVKKISCSNIESFGNLGRHHISICEFQNHKFIAIDGKGNDYFFNKFINGFFKLLS